MMHRRDALHEAAELLVSQGRGRQAIALVELALSQGGETGTVLLLALLLLATGRPSDSRRARAHLRTLAWRPQARGGLYGFDGS